MFSKIIEIYKSIYIQDIREYLVTYIQNKGKLLLNQSFTITKMLFELDAQPPICLFGTFNWNSGRCSVFYTSTKSWRGYIFTAVCLCERLSIYVCDRLCLWTKFQPNGCTDLDAIFAKRLFTPLAQTLWKLVTLVKGQDHRGSIFIFSS